MKLDYQTIRFGFEEFHKLLITAREIGGGGPLIMTLSTGLRHVEDKPEFVTLRAASVEAGMAALEAAVSVVPVEFVSFSFEHEGRKISLHKTSGEALSPSLTSRVRKSLEACFVGSRLGDVAAQQYRTDIEVRDNGLAYFLPAEVLATRQAALMTLAKA